MTDIYDLAASKIEEAGLATAGIDLFVYHAPDKIKRCVLVIESLDGIMRDENLPGYKKADFKVIVRDTDYKSALTIAKAVASALDLHRLTLDEIYVLRMRSTHDPIAFPLSDSDVVEVSVPMWACFVQN